MRILILSFIFAFTFLLCQPPPGYYAKRRRAHRGYHRKYKKPQKRKYRNSSNRRYSKPVSGSRNKIVYYAKKQLGTKYKFGGNAPGGFDCSGLTQYVYKKAAKLSLPRSAKAQSSVGRRTNRPRKGDLIFFSPQGRGISHVGIYLGNYKFIHAPSSGKRIRIDSLKNHYWKRAYRFSKSILNR